MKMKTLTRIPDFAPVLSDDEIKAVYSLCGENGISLGELLTQFVYDLIREDASDRHKGAVKYLRLHSPIKEQPRSFLAYVMTNYGVNRIKDIIPDKRKDAANVNAVVKFLNLYEEYRHAIWGDDYGLLYTLENDPIEADDLLTALAAIENFSFSLERIMNAREQNREDGYKL